MSSSGATMLKLNQKYNMNEGHQNQFETNDNSKMNELYLTSPPINDEVVQFDINNFIKIKSALEYDNDIQEVHSKNLIETNVFYKNMVIIFMVYSTINLLFMVGELQPFLWFHIMVLTLSSLFVIIVMIGEKLRVRDYLQYLDWQYHNNNEKYNMINNKTSLFKWSNELQQIIALRPNLINQTQLLNILISHHHKVPNDTKELMKLEKALLKTALHYHFLSPQKQLFPKTCEKQYFKKLNKLINIDYLKSELPNTSNNIEQLSFLNALIVKQKQLKNKGVPQEHINNYIENLLNQNSHIFVYTEEVKQFQDKVAQACQKIIPNKVMVNYDSMNNVIHVNTPRVLEQLTELNTRCDKIQGMLQCNPNLHVDMSNIENHLSSSNTIVAERLLDNLLAELQHVENNVVQQILENI